MPLSEGGVHVLLLQRLSGRSVNPGLQMFGQSISGNVDMDGNGYAGNKTPLAAFKPFGPGRFIALNTL